MSAQVGVVERINMQKQRKRKFKWRMLRNISLILAASMVLGSVISFVYFEAVVRSQEISDERAKLRQVTGQIRFMVEDVQRFAQSILIDQELQESLALEPFTSEFQRQSSYDRIANRLIFYNNLRSYINNSMLKMESGIWYGTSYVRYSEQMPGEELIVQNSTEDSPYSKVYNRGADGEPIICYQVQMLDKYHFGERKGTLYLEIYLNSFLEQVRLYAENYKHVCLVRGDGAVLYAQDAEGLLQDYLVQMTEVTDKQAVKVDRGYLLCESVEETGWKLCMLIPNEFLWERSQFVLEFFALSFFISLGLILVFISRMMERMIWPVTQLSEQMEYGNMEMLQLIHTGDEIETLYECCDHMLQEIKRGTEAQMRYERQKKEMEFDIMLSQINPHYLYNVLNTVVYLASAKQEWDVVEIVRSLLYSLHETLNIGEHSIEATIEQELELTECYLRIQTYRYPGRYTVNIHCEEALQKCVVPKTIIQPLVENAILHGILPAEEPGNVCVRIFVEDGQLHITVEDDGVGIAKECLEQFAQGEVGRAEQGGRKHIGISNVRDRICFLYGATYGMKIERRKEKGTRVWLRLPLLWEKTQGGEERRE